MEGILRTDESMSMVAGCRSISPILPSADFDRGKAPDMFTRIVRTLLDDAVSDSVPVIVGCEGSSSMIL